MNVKTLKELRVFKKNRGLKDIVKEKLKEHEPKKP